MTEAHIEDARALAERYVVPPVQMDLYNDLLDAIHEKAGDIQSQNLIDRMVDMADPATELDEVVALYDRIVVLATDLHASPRKPLYATLLALVLQTPAPADAEADAAILRLA